MKIDLERPGTLVVTLTMLSLTAIVSSELGTREIQLAHFGDLARLIGTMPELSRNGVASLRTFPERMESHLL
jgi:hypothetical protein